MYYDWLLSLFVLVAYICNKLAKLCILKKKKSYKPEPQTTKTNSANNAGPTGYFSSDGFWKRQENYWHNPQLQQTRLPSGKTTMNPSVNPIVTRNYHQFNTYQCLWNVSSCINILRMLFIRNPHSLFARHLQFDHNFCGNELVILLSVPVLPRLGFSTR